MALDDEPQWRELLERAHAAGVDAFRRAATEPYADLCGGAKVLITPEDDDLARWLTRTGGFHPDPDHKGAVSRRAEVKPEEAPGIRPPIVAQSYLAAHAYAGVYVAVLVTAGVSAHPRSWLN
ncbi:hypothetical protein [Streptosporangium sp. NPDC051022]|uniref:hypothetical protein n=1 Tax=Streptosporangium sp. NPDC051022 TaxID=3155752 RepID=UPI0034198BDD